MFDDLNPNVIIVLVVMVVGAVRWVIEQLKGTNQNKDEGPTSEFEDLYEEARLEILDRQARISPDSEEVSRHLGPATGLHPPGIPTPRPLVTSPPPIPLTASPPPIRKAAAPAKKRALSKEEKAALAAVEARTSKVTLRRKRSSTSANIRRLLASPSTAQDAIVLADILGPPKGSR